MDRKKIKIKTIHVRLDPITYEKLLKCQGEWWTLTRTIEESIHGFYYAQYKTNNLPDNFNTSRKINVGNDEQLTEEQEREELERLKARRKARKEGALNE